MPETAQDQLVRLTSSHSAWLEAALTPEQFKLVTPVKDRVFLDSVGETFTPGDLGYISPSQVKRYFSPVCNQTFEGSPQLRVYIGFEDEWHDDGIAGRYFFLHPLPPDKRNSTQGNEDFILHGHISAQDVLERRVDRQYVKEDNSGRIIPVTAQSVQDELAFQERIVGDTSWSRGDFTKVLKLAQIVGVDISGKVDELKKKGEEKYIQMYSSVEHLEKVLGDLEEKLDFSGFHIPNDEEGADYYLTPFFEFVDHVERARFPNEDLRRKAIEVLNQMAVGYQTTSELQTGELEKYIAEKKKEIALLGGQAINIRALVQKISKPKST